ncbi:MAG: YfhO family protein [Anaerolineae bacterium]
MESAFERRPWLVPLVLALLTVIFLRPALLPPDGEVLAGNDLRSFVYPLYTYTSELVRSGELPLWNPRTFIGVPLIGNPQAALFYPATWLIWLLGADRSIGLVLALHIWLAAWGMARLARSFGATHSASLAAGIIYAMSEWAGARFYAGHFTLLLVFAWIPWAISAYHHALKTGTWRSALPGAAVIGLSLLAGHPPLSFYMALCLLALLGYHTVMAEDSLKALWQGAQLLVFMGIIGLILGAALLLPVLEFTRLSVRESTDLNFINSFALPPAQFLGLALPGLFGNPTQSPVHYWGADFYEEFAAYAGLLPLLALPLAFRNFRRQHAYFVGLVAFGLVMSIGLEGALLPVLVRWLPGFSFFRSPGRALFFVVLGLSGLSSLLITHLQQSAPESRRALLQPVLKWWLPASIGLAFAGSVFFSGWYASASHVEPMPTRAFVVAGALALSGVVLCGLWAALWLWTRGENTSLRWALPVLLTVLTLDAWRVPLQLITTIPGWRDALWQGAVVNVPTGADARVIEIPNDSPYNGSFASGHLHVLGYDPLMLATFDKLQNISDPHDPVGTANTLMGVKYALAKKPYDRPNFELIGIADGGIYYRRTDPFPRAWIANNVIVEPNDDAVRQLIAQDVESLRFTAIIDHPVDCSYAGRATSQITGYHANIVTVETTGAGGVLVLSDQYYPGWEAQVDGQSTEIVRAFTAFRAVCAPPGDHTITFAYRPLSLLIGAALSGLGWLLMGIVGVVAWQQKRTQPNILP